MEQAILDYIEETKKCIVKAAQLFNVDLTVDNVIIECNVRGETAGWAHGKKNGKYRVRFNREAIIKGLPQMADTIPHEVAHLVCYADRRLGSGHDAGWKRVCRMLGGDDGRTHDMVLTPHREKQLFDYTMPSGRKIQLGPKYHANIQAHRKQYWTRAPREEIRAHHWDGYTQATAIPQPSAIQKIQQKLGIVHCDVPDLSRYVSKREKAEALYKCNRGLERKDMIALFVRHADMTPAGAATYYQTFKSKNL